MINTVRQRIIDAIKEALTGAASGRIQRVFMPGEDFGPISAIVAAGKCAVELYVGDDVVPGEERSGIEQATFDVALVIDMPKATSDDAGGSMQLAHDINAEIYKLYATADGSGGQWGGLALRTTWQGFGGVYVSDFGPATVHGMSVTYRFRLGDPESAA